MLGSETESRWRLLPWCAIGVWLLWRMVRFLQVAFRRLVCTPETPRKGWDIEKHLVCALTGKLPLDPVLADDECLYERTALEKHIQSHAAASRVLLSPTKKEHMSKRFTRAPQVKRVIQELIETGVLTGHLAQDWKERQRLERTVEELKKDAAEGDVSAMISLGEYYRTGAGRQEKDASRQSFQYWDQARKHGSIIGTAYVGEMWMNGIGTTQHQRKGIMYLSLAAKGGSDLAAYWLGSALADGTHGLPVDREEGIDWLKQSVSGRMPHKHMSKEDLQKAQQSLEEQSKTPIGRIRQKSQAEDEEESEP
jgi:Sel1 repeat